MERLGLKTPSKLKNKIQIGRTRRKMAGYRDVLDSPTNTSSATINHLFEHHDENIQVMEGDITIQCSFESADNESTSDNETSFRATKDAPGFVSSRGLVFCSDDTRCDTITHTVSPDFRLGTNGRNMNMTHQSKMEKEPTRETAEHDEIELISNCSSSSTTTTTTSLPPPGFCLPRKEIRDAIMYHEELGKALSKLALDPVMQCTDDNGGKSSAASTNSTAESTLDTTLDSSISRCRVNALRIDSKRPTRQNFTIGFDHTMEQVSCSESFSSKSEFGSGSNQWNRLEQHLAFLENHAMKQFPSTTISQSDTEKNYNSTENFESFDDCFFPRADDLQSIPASASWCDVSKCISSPPNTPKFNVLGDEHQLWIGNTGHERNDNLRLIKDEIAHIMSDYIDKTRSDISSTVDTQLEKHLSKLKSDIFHLIERLDKSAQTSISQGNIRYHTSPFGEISKTPHSGNSMGGGGLPNEFEKALSSMETRIINTITSEIRANVMQQRHVIEEIVEEKFSVAIAGSNLKLISDIQQIVRQQEIDRASVMTKGNKASPPTASLRIGSLRKHICGPQPSSDNSVGAGTKTRSNMYDNSCITSTNSEDIFQKSLEDSFSETMQAIDQFVADCDEIASDFDRIALRMESNDEYNGSDCDTEEFEVLIGTASGFVMF